MLITSLILITMGLLVYGLASGMARRGPPATPPPPAPLISQPCGCYPRKQKGVKSTHSKLASFLMSFLTKFTHMQNSSNPAFSGTSSNVVVRSGLLKSQISPKILESENCSKNQPKVFGNVIGFVGDVPIVQLGPNSFGYRTSETASTPAGAADMRTPPPSTGKVAPARYHFSPLLDPVFGQIGWTCGFSRVSRSVAARIALEAIKYRDEQP